MRLRDRAPRRLAGGFAQRNERSVLREEDPPLPMDSLWSGSRPGSSRCATRGRGPSVFPQVSDVLPDVPRRSFPKLNPFGEAFRLNGYRMPKETEEQIKIKPVSLGADAYKRLWPKTV